MSKPALKVGAKLHVWWNTGTSNNMATVLAILPYTGRYTEHFDCVLRLTAPNTRAGWLEMAYRKSEYAYDALRYAPTKPRGPNRPRRPR
jgi:hypothetical protein